MKKAFTLAEVLITLAIIGVVAALTIPSVILNTNQTEYKTALKKSVSVLNQAVSLELALENLSPSEANSAQAFLNMLQTQMNTVTSASGCANAGSQVSNGTEIASDDACAFTTTDGIQFVFVNSNSIKGADASAAAEEGDLTQNDFNGHGCYTTDDDHNFPCYLLVDVNGSKNPNQLTTDSAAPKDRFILEFKGSNGTTVTPVGAGAEIMFAK